jgi:hypothetical protein
MFKDRYGVQQVSKSVFWINTTATVDIAKITNVQVTVKNDTTFQVKYSATYKGGGLTKDTVVGNFTVTFKFYRDVKPKISVQFVKDESAWSKGGLGDFNVVWVILPTKNYLKINETSAVDYTAYTSMVKIKETTVKEDKKCEIGNSANPFEWTGSWLLAFWDDVDGASVLYAGLDKVFGSKGITVVFPINNGQVDPSIVGLSTTYAATLNPFQRKSFYANGRYWVFWGGYYSGGTNYMVYSTSTDGITWSSATTVRAAAYGYLFSVWFDGTYLHYAYAAGGSIYYRRGTPNSNGTITWSAVEQTVSTTYNSANYPMVSVDSNGYVWIGYQDYDGTYYYPYVIKSGRNDGTWGTTPLGFPFQLSTTSSAYWKVSVIPLTGGKMLAVYAYNSATVKAKAWTGYGWNSEITTTSAIYSGSYHSAVAQGNDVHLVFLKSTGFDILYVKYIYSSNSFGTETTLQAGATSSSAPVISIDAATNDLYVFWIGYPTARHIYYRKYTASTGQWETVVDWIIEMEALTGNDRLTCFYQAGGNTIGLLYITGTVNPYNVKFAYLSLITKIWHDIALWTENALTRKWLDIASFSENLLTRKFYDVALWSFQTLTRKWFDISYFIVNALTRKWQFICEWSYSVFSKAWRSLVNWLFSLHSVGWSDIALWLASIYSIVSVVIVPVIKWGMLFGLALAFAVVLALIFEGEKKE